MPKVNSLAQLQAYFTKQLALEVTDSSHNQKPTATLNPLESLTNLLVESHFTPEQLINIYRNNFVISLRELLENLFPVTQALVGSEYFTHTSRQFINDCPLKEPHLNHYGGYFVSFIEGLKALEHMPFVAQMAQLEWHLDRISHIYHQPNFDFDGLTQINEDQHLNIHFHLAETCYLQTSSMDLIALHKDFSEPKNTSLQGETKETNYQQQSYILVLQNHQGKSALMPTSQQHFAWLTGLKNGLTLAQLCNIENTDITSLMSQITDWIALGCIDGFSLRADTQA
jgi:hypothetical protein